MLTSNTGAEYMRNAIPDRPPLSDGADATKRQLPGAALRRSRLSHQQARGSLLLLLDATTEPALAERLRQHVDGCARCQVDLEQLRQAERWLLAQPVEVPEMAAREDAAWAAIQARIAAEDGSLPVVEKAHSNGHSNGLNHYSSTEAAMLVPFVAASADTDSADAPKVVSIARPVPLPLPSSSEIMTHSVFGKPGMLNPRRVVFVALAAALIVGSFAALFLAKFYATSDSTAGETTPLFSMGVLDPGSETTTFSFDPVSNRVLTLSGEMSYGCPPGASCPYIGPDCLGFSMLDAFSGKVVNTVRPSCTPGKYALNSTTFTNMLDDSAKGEALLVGSDQKVRAIDTQSGTTVENYTLDCCSNGYSQPYWTALDERDQLLLTTAQSDQLGVPGTLVAQDATTGKLKYQTPLDTSELQATLVSNVTGWLYFWNRCSMTSNMSCVEVYAANSGKKVTAWQANSQQTPLAADPTENILYVRADYSNAPSQTLVIDGRSGKTVDHLPAAQAMAFNTPLHHAYLLDSDGVTVLDTSTRRKLSTLPVLAHDENWLAPAVDVATSQLYVPIQRGKLLMVQDNAAGQLSLRSASLGAVLEAERAMTVDEANGAMGLSPWELPVGPNSAAVYIGMSRETPSSCGVGWTAARSAATVSSQGDGAYQVQISLAWDDQFANTLTPPASQPSYPDEHTWLYTVPASGNAWLSSQHGAAFSHC